MRTLFQPYCEVLEITRDLLNTVPEEQSRKTLSRKLPGQRWHPQLSDL